MAPKLGGPRVREGLRRVLASGSGENAEVVPFTFVGEERMNAVKYDLIVVGSGPSGQRAAVAASKLKKRVAIIESRSVVGGVCINTGTIPSKTMREAVLHLSGYNYRTVYGMNYRVKEKITMADLAFRVQGVVKTEIDVTEAQLSRNGIDVMHGIAHFHDQHTLRVEGPAGDTTLSSERIIIAVGTKPAISTQGAHQRPHHHQQRSDPGPARAAAHADCCGRRRDRRGVRLHVRHPGRARHHDRKAQPRCLSLPIRRSWRRSAIICATAGLRCAWARKWRAWKSFPTAPWSPI